MDVKVHHIGYAVPLLENGIKEFAAVGWEVCSEVTDDLSRKVRIVFMRSGAQLVELVAPLSDDSPVCKYIQRGVGAPYHICYEVASLELAEIELKKQGFIPFKRPACAPAIGNRQVEFMFAKNIGVVELLGRGVI